MGPGFLKWHILCILICISQDTTRTSDLSKVEFSSRGLLLFSTLFLRKCVSNFSWNWHLCRVVYLLETMRIFVIRGL